MSAGRPALSLALRRAVAHAVRHRGVSTLTVCAVAAALACVGLARLVSNNVRQLTEEWGHGVQMIVYLEDGVTDDRAGEIAGVLNELPAVEAVTYVPPEQALEHLRGSLDGHVDLTEGLEQGMLPASLEVSLARGTRNVASAGPVITRLERIPGIESVEFLGAWAERLTAFVDKLRRGGVVLTGLAALLVVFVMGAAMRLTSATRRAEDRVLALQGASATLRRGTLAIEGAVLGFAGAGLAVVLLAVLFAVSAPAVQEALALVSIASNASFLTAGEVLALLSAGAGLGALGAGLSQRSHGSVA